MNEARNICPNVLIVGDDSAAIRMIQETLAAEGVRGIVESSAARACEKMQDAAWDMILCDADSANHGLELLRAAKRHQPERPVILVGSAGSISSVVDAVRQGCDDYLTKPLSTERLRELIQALLPNHKVPVAASAEQDTRCLYRMAGQSPQFLQTLRLAHKVAPTSVPVLISGESGTGKELISYFIHSQSNRSRGPYIRVNCAALSESLLESELFGHERGAFTGAYAQRKGRFELAHGGTLLLDEISETTPRLQAELLRVLEQQDFERVGGHQNVRVNVRVISTTNRDLAAEVQHGRFRGDLYYRISGMSITVPPLRERRDDLPALVWHFVNLYAREVKRKIVRLDEEMLAALEQCHWPGNIRQLRNVVRTALVMGEGPTLSLAGAEFLLGTMEQLGRPQFQSSLQPGPQSQPGNAVGSYMPGDGSYIPHLPADRRTVLSLQELERRAILDALQRSQRNQAKAARLLGITDRTLREKLRRYRQEQAAPPGGTPAPIAGEAI